MPYPWLRPDRKKSRKDRDAEYLRNLDAIRKIVLQMPNETLNDKVRRVFMENQLLIGYREGVRYC